MIIYKWKVYWKSLSPIVRAVIGKAHNVSGSLFRFKPMRFDVIKQMYLKPKIKRLGKSYRVYVQQTSPKLFLPTRNLNEHFGTEDNWLNRHFSLKCDYCAWRGAFQITVKDFSKGKIISRPTGWGAVSVIYNPHPHPTLPREKNDINKN